MHHLTISSKLAPRLHQLGISFEQLGCKMYGHVKCGRQKNPGIVQFSRSGSDAFFVHGVWFTKENLSVRCQIIFIWFQIDVWNIYGFHFIRFSVTFGIFVVRFLQPVEQHLRTLQRITANRIHPSCLRRRLRCQVFVLPRFTILLFIPKRATYGYFFPLHKVKISRFVVLISDRIILFSREKNIVACFLQHRYKQYRYVFMYISPNFFIAMHCKWWWLKCRSTIVEKHFGVTYFTLYCTFLAQYWFFIYIT